jgi:DNA-binding CsgD family transcriptional regulator
MEKRAQEKDKDCETLLEDAKDRIEQVEARVEKANTSAELAESRVELAETRTELAETRAALAEVRARHAETALRRAIENGINGAVSETPKTNGAPDVDPLAGVSGRQREILRLIAEGKNTKQIASQLELSPKTVEYHRAKLMRVTRLHDVPSLVRLAIRAGLVPEEC